MASFTTSFVGDCCLVEPGVGQSQGVGVDSEDSYHSENYVSYNESKGEKSFFTQTADNIELERSSHLQDTLLNDNDADWKECPTDVKFHILMWNIIITCSHV